MKEHNSSYGPISVTGDGDALCAKFDDYINPQESPAGFGYTEEAALAALAVAIRSELDKTKVLASIMLEILQPFANYACNEPCSCHNCRARDIVAKAKEVLSHE